MRNLDRHNLVCSENNALTGYKIEKNEAGQVRFMYECCSIFQSVAAIESTVEHETAQTDLYVSLHSAHYLDRQTVKCPGINQLINRMQMRSIRGKLWFSLTCYQLGSVFELGDAEASSSEVFDMGSKITYEFDQKEVACNNSGFSGVQFLIESKLKMNYNTKPHSAVFNLECAAAR